MITDPYDDDDDSPTLQRPANSSSGIPLSATPRTTRATGATRAVGVFLEESSTDTDLAPLDLMADAHTADSLPPEEAVALMDAPDYSDMETPKIPLDVAAVLLRASQDDDASGN